MQIRHAISTYFLPLFSASTSIGAVSVSSGKAAEVEAGFIKLGFDVERRELPMLGSGDAGESDGSQTDGDDGSYSSVDS